MPDDETVKKMLLGKPDRRRKAGRPKYRWLDCIENNLWVSRDGGRKLKTDLHGISF
jgi:hypothetical protein